MAKHALHNPYSRAIVTFLRTNGPAPINVIVAHIGAQIPPGEAIRHFQRRMNSGSRHRTFDTMDDDTMIRRGRRDLITGKVAGFLRSGRVTTTQTDHGTVYQLANTGSFDNYQTVMEARDRLQHLLDDAGHARECPWRPHAETWPECHHPDHTREWAANGDKLRL